MYPIERYIILIILCIISPRLLIFIVSFYFGRLFGELKKSVRNENDEGVRKERFSVFVQSARPFGDPVQGNSFSINDMVVAHWFVLNNCDEIMAYLDEHEEMMKREHPSHLYAKKHRELFPQWFLEYVSYKCFVFDIYIVVFNFLKLTCECFCIILGELIESIKFPHLQ